MDGGDGIRIGTGGGGVIYGSFFCFIGMELGMRIDATFTLCSVRFAVLGVRWMLFCAGVGVLFLVAGASEMGSEK